MRRWLMVLVGGVALGCGGNDTEGAEVDDTTTEVDATDTEVDATDTEVDGPRDRLPGERRARTARCDDTEPDACLVPWPSSAFLTLDPNTPTGVRVSIAADTLLPDDGLDVIDADGFSRITPIISILPSGLTDTDVEVRLFEVEPELGHERPVDLRLVFGRNPNDRDTLIAYPRFPLSAGREHLVVILAKGDTATRWSPSRPTELALGATPQDQAEAELAAYHAPARQVLDTFTDTERARVVRAWDFITRSADDPRAGLRDLAAEARAAVISGTATIALTSVEVRHGPMALIVEGAISGLHDGESTFSVPFRVAVPSGEGDYRYVLYCHGASGTVRDTAFDELITESGAAKVNVEIDGWTEATIADSISGLLIPIVGSHQIVERMRRSFAGITAIHAAIDGPLGELLGNTRLLDIDNPTADRKPRLGPPIWTGGSLGGTVGAVYGQLEPSIVGGVLNVPGAGFTHWLSQSDFTSLLDLALAGRYPKMVDQQVVLSMSQMVWDQVDGAIWADARAVPPIFLVQRSIGDPVMPGVGPAMVARSLGAVQTLPEGAQPILGLDLERAPTVIGQSAYTEFLTDETSATAIHGFAARDSEAGRAARDQIQAFIATLWAGAPVIEIPTRCYEAARPGICDFSR